MVASLSRYQPHLRRWLPQAAHNQLPECRNNKVTNTNQPHRIGWSTGSKGEEMAMLVVIAAVMVAIMLAMFIADARGMH